LTKMMAFECEEKDEVSRRKETFEKGRPKVK
jgi:hypothetical protein